MAILKPLHPERVYVKVTSVFDRTGYMMPTSIIWDDGRVFKIDAVQDFRPSACIARGLPGDCYTVVIKGERRHLFFVREERRFPAHFGRWFVETFHE